MELTWRLERYPETNPRPRIDIAGQVNEWHAVFRMTSSSPADEPFSIEHRSVRRDLASVERTLDELAVSVFHLLTEGRHLWYRTSPAAVAAHGHATIQSTLLRILQHETGQPRDLNVDVLHHEGTNDPLIVVRNAPDNLWVLLRSEYAYLGFPLP